MRDGGGRRAEPLVARPVTLREAWRICAVWDAEYDALVERSTGARAEEAAGA